MSKTGTGGPSGAGSASTPALSSVPTPSSAPTPSPAPIELDVPGDIPIQTQDPAAAEDPLFSPVDSTAAQLLSTAPPDGLSNPYIPAPGWVTDSPPINPYSNTPNGFSSLSSYAGQDVDALTGVAPAVDNSNPSTGATNQNPQSGLQNVAWFNDAATQAATSGLASADFNATIERILNNAVAGASSEIEIGPPYNPSPNIYIDGAQSYQIPLIENPVPPTSPSTPATPPVAVQTQQPTLVTTDGSQTPTLSANAAQQLDNAIQQAAGPPDATALNLGQPATIADVLSGTDWASLLNPATLPPAPAVSIILPPLTMQPTAPFDPIASSPDWNPFGTMPPQLPRFSSLPPGVNPSGWPPLEQPNWTARMLDPTLSAGIAGGLFSNPLPTGPLNFPGTPELPIRVPGFGPESFRYPFVEPGTPPPASLPPSPTVPATEPPGALGILEDVFGAVGGLLMGLATIVGAGIAFPGDASLHAAPRTTPQDLVDAGWHYHHWFPQEFNDEFNELGIDVDRYTTLIPPDLHIPIHQDGWNEAWRDWLDDAEQHGYTANDAVAFLYELLQPYLQQLEDIGVMGPNGLKAIVPYPHP